VWNTSRNLFGACSRSIALTIGEVLLFFFASKDPFNIAASRPYRTHRPCRGVVSVMPTTKDPDPEGLLPD
jgi:hypothetical protein